MIDKEKLLSHLNDREDELALSYILDKVELALKRSQPLFTYFLNPYHLHLARPILEELARINFFEYGGYSRAERRILGLMPDYYLREMVESPITILSITGQFRFQKVSHRDFLGAILGTGIKREMVGDLVVFRGGCQVVIAKEIKDYLIFNLEQVHKVGVEIEEIGAKELKIEPEKVKLIEDTVPSLRLDSVASSGFGTSRTKMSQEIEQGKVKVNWKVIKDTAYLITEDDLISIRGRGRVEIDELFGESRRGRLKIRLKKYI